MATIRSNGHTLVCDAPHFEVTPMRVPDTKWRYTDQHGHEHRWADNETVPTVRRVVDADVTDEYPEINHYECRECGDRVEPAMRMPDCRMYARGLPQWSLDGQPITEADAKALMEQWREEVSRRKQGNE